MTTQAFSPSYVTEAAAVPKFVNSNFLGFLLFDGDKRGLAKGIYALVKDSLVTVNVFLIFEES